MFSKDKVQHPVASVEAGVAAQQAQVVENAVTGKDGVAEAVEEKEHGGTETKKASKGDMVNYFRVLSYGTNLDYFLMAMCCLTAIGSGITMPLMNIVFGQLVGNFTNYFIPGTTVTRNEFQAEINRLALLIVYLFIGKFVLTYIAMLTIRISGLRISAALRLAYLRALFAQPIPLIDTISPGKVSTRITTSSNTIQLAISQHLAMLFQSLAFTIGLYVVAFTKSWLLTLVASAALPFILVVYGMVLPPFIRIHKVTERHVEDASAMAFEMFASVRIVTAFGAEGKLARLHRGMLGKAMDNSKRAAPLTGLMIAPSMMAMYGTFGLTFWYGIKQYSEGRIADVGVITVVLFSVMMAVMNIGRLVAPIIAIAKAGAAATELFTTIDAPVPDTSGVKEPDISADADIVFENVSFSYPSRPNVQILDKLNLTLRAGKVTAIVGPSGSGKSTIVGLVQRWYELLGTTAMVEITDQIGDQVPVDVLAKEEEKPRKFRAFRKAGTPKTGDKNHDNTAKPSHHKKPAKPQNANQKKEPEPDLGPNTCTGSIRTGTTNLRTVDLKWWRSQIGLVQQEPFLFNDTLYNNVAYGLCGTHYEDLPRTQKLAMVEEACREAYADEFICKLPQGYDTLVGESGIRLSGGQRQRIAIARSIIKRPPILILDEATSAIDVRTERVVQKALDRVARGRTTIVIAHRLSTVRRADAIVVLRQGECVEQGTHEELLQIEAGVYRSLVQAQELTTEAQEDDECEEPTTERAQSTTSKAQESSPQNHTSSDDNDTTYKEKGLLRSVGRLVAEQRHHWFLYTLATLGILGAGAVYPLQAYIFANVIQVFVYTGPRLVREGNFWAAMFGVETAGVGLSYYILGTATHLISTHLVRHYRQEYLVNMIRKRIPFFDDPAHSPGSLTARLSSDPTQIQQLMSTEMSLALIAIVNLVGSLILSFVYGWKLSLVGLFSVLPVILTAGYYRMRLEIGFEAMNAKVFENSSQFATEAVGAFRTVLSLIMEDTIGARYEALLAQHVRQAFGSAKYSTLVFAASDSVELACMALTFWYGGTLLAAREYGLVDFFVVYMAVVQGAVAAGTWFSFAPNMAQATGAANRILSMRPPSIPSPPPTNNPLIPNSSPLGPSISIHNLSFTYASRPTPVLSNLTLSIPAGHFAALVGSSGCGKSTLISLLERFYEPTSGTILLDNTPINTHSPSAHRAQISLVSQESALYDGSIAANVALSVDEGDEGDGDGDGDGGGGGGGGDDDKRRLDIEAACRDAQIHDFIASLPEGYNTRLGPKGLSLSGGQRQRVALARALLRRPRLLLLDEATSSLDSESEKLVQGAIERVAGVGRTCTVLAVAHRLATIQQADVIFVLGSGRVLEQGDHQSLLRRRGVYWQMCQAQALDR
ncbi:leptomycin B resistance protein pmd1 [Dothidotthia symphoricarpi CBS 119687]|uniref:Leptomycin B resistance protein pmd1 n=1 Tax=Dothidotthia symphoricarpi CBS 119687 TaxID=1392245 RepID=A0A6A6A6W5_9PLEO|nr:leptomycin B resistance protein pmd1 [Dothidotthia symphoricarpi CBS 119687]KAF2127639.1 leptomycin B resistance protein pmd1 [Dothidotthia symphoricarpi CBS 119687]